MQTTEQSKTLAKNYNAVKENIKKGLRTGRQITRGSYSIGGKQDKAGGYAYGCLPCGCQGLRRE